MLLKGCSSILASRSFISMALTAVVIGIVGVIIGVSFTNCAILQHIAIPIMAGELVLVLPLSGIYARDGRWIRRNFV